MRSLCYIMHNMHT